MADAPATSESPAQEKARLRRERRAAKIAAGGAERLQAISALQGGSHRDVEKDVPAKPSPSPRPRTTASGTDTPDPEDVDISQHHYTPASQPRLPSPFSFDRNDASTPPLFPAPGQPRDPAADPLMAMMQQMMGSGGMPTGQGHPGAPGELPPGIANLFSAMSGSAAPEPAPEQSSAWLWRLVHSLFSLCLAIYIVLRTPFTGTKLSRTAAPGDDWMQEGVRGDGFAHFFYLFATFEVAMQSSRFFIEQGRLQGNGILSTIGGFLPEPYAGYVRLAGRYSVIYSTVVSDAMVIVFVLGAAHWWNGDVLA